MGEKWEERRREGGKKKRRKAGNEDQQTKEWTDVPCYFILKREL